MKFNKKEIKLCEQIAERHRKEIKEGDWVVLFQDYADGTVEPWVFSVDYVEEDIKGDHKTCKPICIKEWDDDHKMMSIGFNEVTPLWTISDCLEFLREKEHSFERAYQLGGIFNVSFISGEGTKKGSGDTLLEACLKAVLAICVA